MSDDARLTRIDQELEALRGHVERELKKDRRTRLTSLIVGGLATVLVFVYMFWLHGELKRFVTPRSAAEAVERYTREVLPGLGTELARSLNAAAPDVAKELETRFLKDILPELRRLGEDQLVTLAGHAVAVAETQMTETVTAVIRQNKAALLAQAEGPSVVGPDPLAQRLEAAFEVELTRRFAESPDQPLYAQLEQSKEQLRSIDQKLRALAQKKDLSRIETLEKRLIQSWLLFVDQKGKEADVSQP